MSQKAVYAAARAWVSERAEDWRDDVPDRDVRAFVTRHYPGGWQAFSEDNAQPVYRWIMYLHAPGGLGGDLKRVTSHAEAKHALVQYGRDSGFHQDLTVYGTYGPTATLYPYSEDDWAEAERMRDTGCPFDYPSYEVTSGPRGGVTVRAL